MASKLYKKILKNFFPRKYAKKIGINTDEVHVYGHVVFGTEPWILSFGENVYITDGMKFVTHDGGTLLFRTKQPDFELTGPISVGNNVYIGNNVLILKNVKIGDNVIIGAGSVVTKDVPSNCVAAGVPAKPLESLAKYFEKNIDKSLKLGNLSGKEKDLALKKYFKYDGKSKGIYF